MKVNKRSIGNKVEKQLNGVQVYEYGHSSNDLADQMYLMYNNKEVFDLIDYVIIGIKYENDLLRSEYEYIERKPLFPLLRHSKLIVYMLNIGLMDPVKDLRANMVSIKNNGLFGKGKKPDHVSDNMTTNKDSLYLENFKNLVVRYGLNKNKTAFLLDGRVTDDDFLKYLSEENINYIDFSNSFENANKKPTTLIYDMHWNDYGRTLIAKEITEYIKGQQ